MHADDVYRRPTGAVPLCLEPDRTAEGFIALLGALVAQEDHAQRAVLAAPALHAQVGTSTPDPRQALEEPVALCLGLHTGRVVVDRLGRSATAYTAASETTQVALRLRQPRRQARRCSVR